MHFVEAKTILTPQNGMNLYRGCTNNCIYCDARSKSNRLEHEFTDVSVKEAGDRLLENVLRKKRTRSMIQTGALSDPYMACEAEMKLMRKCLMVVEHYDFGIVIRTKSSLILRDLDILSAINRKTKCIVVVPVSGSDDASCRKLEPDASSFTERVAIIKTLYDAGIPSILAIEPVIPMLNDTEENLLEILKIAEQYHVYGIEHKDFSITLRDGSREYFHQGIKAAFPERYDAFMERYGSENILISPEQNRLLTVLSDFCEAHGIVCNQEEIRRYKRIYENKTLGTQLTFVDFL